MQTATAGCSRKSPRDCPDGWTRTARHSPPQPSSRSHSDVPRPHTASTRSGAASAMRIGRTGTLNTSSASRLAKSCRHEQRLRLPCQSARFRGLKRSCNGRCSTATRQFRECPVFAHLRRSALANRRSAVMSAGPTGAVVTMNSPRRAFWEELGEARRLPARSFFEGTDCGCSRPSVRL